MDGFLLYPLTVFTSAWWLSAGLGIGVGMLYGITSLLVNRYALRQDHRRFMVIALGGMALRLAVTLLLIALIVLLLPVQAVTFLAFFLGVFVFGMVMEVWYLHHGAAVAAKT